MYHSGIKLSGLQGYRRSRFLDGVWSMITRCDRTSSDAEMRLKRRLRLEL